MFCYDAVCRHEIVIIRTDVVPFDWKRKMGKFTEISERLNVAK